MFNPTQHIRLQDFCAFSAHTGNIKALQSSITDRAFDRAQLLQTGNACPLTYGYIIFTVHYANI